MADRSILFSAPMVRAILREIECPGTGKTQTRRVLDAWCDEPPAFVRDGVIMALNAVDRPYRWPRTHAVGDRFLVGEAWRTELRYDQLPPRDIPVGSRVSYEADYDREPNDGCRGRLRLGRFLPFWARRLVAPVSAVRVERLQDISDEDALAEGVVDTGRREGAPYQHFLIPGMPEITTEHEPSSVFSGLWEHINGPDSWAANPWVAAYTFAPERRNIDAGGASNA